MASDAATSLDGASGSGRCDPTKPFGPPSIVPNINTGYDEISFVLSANELSGYVLRDNPGDLLTITSTSRGSLDDDFPIDTTDSALANVGGRIGSPWLARSDHLFFELFNGRLNVSERPTTAEPFGTRKLLDIAGVANDGSLHLVGTDADALNLYFYGVDGILQTAPNSFAAYEFDTPVAISSMAIGAGVLSHDRKALYYQRSNDGSGDVYLATRTSTSATFDPGTLLFAAAGWPAFVTKDGCELYFGGGDIRVARRPK